jgi:hypothetical protein
MSYPKNKFFHPYFRATVKIFDTKTDLRQKWLNIMENVFYKIVLDFF